MNRFPLKLVATAALATSLCAPALAQINYSTAPGTPAALPGLTGFTTTGAAMTGLAVTATFSNGLSETRSWTTTGANAGGVTGSGWSLSLDGDSFSSPWNFAFGPNLSAQLTRLVLDGSGALTVLDRTFGGADGTDGSSAGADFTFAGGTCGSCTADALYTGLTSIVPALAVGDLWQTLIVDFTGGTGPRTDWSFGQDTDNDSRFTTSVPEPETYALMLAGLGWMGWLAKRRRRPA